MRTASGLWAGGGSDTDLDGRALRPDQGYINHVAIVMDESASMSGVARRLVEVVDAEIKNMAAQSQKLGQETRVTLYAFSSYGQVRCIAYDRDVLRLPSLRAHYRPAGMTALRDATGKAIDDLEKTAQLYGDHAFLVYVFTDGAENHSRSFSVAALHRRLRELPENWTVAGFVPHESSRELLEQCGFTRGNIAVWDATTEAGVEAGVSVMSAATTSYMTSRSTGVRGTKTLFAGGAGQVNAAERRAHGLRELAKTRYDLLTIDAGDLDRNGVLGLEGRVAVEIRPFVEDRAGQYVQGRAFYELVKTEKIQPQKALLLRNRKSGRVYAGDARAMLGLPNEEVRVKPEANPEYQIFVQSTSVNRKLYEGTKVVLLKEDLK